MIWKMALRDKDLERISILTDSLRGKISTLLENRYSGRESIGSVIFNGDIHYIRSNCLGTLLHCYNINYDAINVICGLGDSISYPAENRPGYIDGLFFEDILLKSFSKIKWPSSGDMVLNRTRYENCCDFRGSTIKHGSIYIKKLGSGKHLVFNQPNAGHTFCFNEINLGDSRDTFFEFCRRH